MGCSALDFRSLQRRFKVRYDWTQTGALPAGQLAFAFTDIDLEVSLDLFPRYSMKDLDSNASFQF